MKRSELIFGFLRIPVDTLAILLAFLVAYYLRIQSDVIYILPLGEYFQFVGWVLPLWLIVFALEGLYEVEPNRRGIEEWPSIFVGVTAGVLLITAAVFLTNTELGSRIVLLNAYLFSLLFVSVGRIGLRWLKQALHRYGIGVRKVILVGTNHIAQRLIKELRTDPGLGAKIVGHVSVNGHEEEGLGRHLGELKDLEAILVRHTPNELIVSDSLTDQQMLGILALVNRLRIDLRLAPNLVGVQTVHTKQRTLAGIPIVEVIRTPLQGWGRVTKRTMDIGGSLIGIVVFSPFMILTALAVKLTSQGPIIYKNERVGQDKNNFHTYKFRSMRIEHSTGAEYGGEKAMAYEQALIESQNSRRGAVYKVANDPRLTPIGEFIRKTSLDEFPQFFNVLKGEMSLVGPRPHQPREVAKYKPWQEKLFTIKPGITGLAQISGRSDLDFDDEARLDISYIENWSLWQDIQILVRTPWSLLASRSRKAS